ncbi:hypothetical protein H310_07292 [Aphanomyces invadans]|uniref:receptor protein-tyrosine kinase n=1 Tax=Aphanomyces invadans TaxID=157072 RepID=A0A024U2T7_9STRA|nr:hypothetical protein H310_07292 [Aphanomyces invadans]ETW00746.1 hypothetical protein H310_07292 [Aphanomyces invadans]|eukprot:XP_008870881.1 hypothetical protein H310_07292 [Aphanomyces invadans]
MDDADNADEAVLTTTKRPAVPRPIPQGYDQDGNRVIPPQLQAEFTTNEGDELIALFESADEDKSGSVDEQEFRKLLVRMDICISDEEVDKLVVEVDTNNNGLIEWDEFVMMVSKAKRGDVRFNKLHAMTESLNTTPVAMLESEAGKFGLDVVFRLLEERKATSYNPKTYVVEVTITTTSPADGSTERQSYQAIGFSSREAKFKAAELALVKMRKMKPGFEFPAGVVPPTWDDWAFNNLNKGVASLKVLKTLVEKGFTPADNLVFMKRFSLHVSYLHVKHQNLDTALVFPNSTSLTTPWCRWVDEQVARGMDGALVLQQLCHGGYDSTKDPHFVQQLLQGKKNGAVPPVYDFWQCVQTGNLHETKLFVCAGQNVNEAKLDRHAKTLYTPLQLAAKLGYLNMVEYFLQHGAEVAAKNSFRRTALMFAARHGHPAVIKLLLRHGASILDRDNLENTPLHMAAMAGCTRSCLELLTFDEEYVRSCIINTNKSLNFLDETRSFRGIVRALFADMMQAKLARNARPTFALAWLHEAVDLAYAKIIAPNHEAAGQVQRPSGHVITRIIHRLQYLQHDIPDTGDEVEVLQMEKDSQLCILNADHLQVYVEHCFLEAYKNAPNRQGRTPLHLACDENLVCTHEGALRVLLDSFGCDPHIKDHMGRTPLDLLLQRKHRPGSPKENRELEVTLQRARHRRRMNHAARRQLEQDAVKRGAFEENLLQQLPRQPETNDIDLKHAMETATVVATIAGWREYKDAQSLNHFYENVNTGQLQLRIPDDVRAALAVRMQWFFRKQSARLLEKRGSWTMHKHAEKQRVFFYNTETGQYQWTKPTVVDGWANIPPNIKRTLDAVATPDSDDEDSDDSEQGEHREGIDQVSQKLLRVFGPWEEHQDAVTGGRVYYNTDTRQLTRDKPDAVLNDELKRQAYALLTKTAEFKDRIGMWDKYFDVRTEHYFVYNRATGEGRHETEYVEGDLRQEAIKASAQDATVQLVRRLTDEELSKQRDNEHWMNILQRARRRDTLTTLVKKEVVDDATRRLNQLNDAILRKIHADFATATMGYRDARVATEQRALMKARALGLFVSEKIVMAPSRASTEAMEFTEWLQREEAESHAVEDTDANPSESARRRIVRLVEDAAWRMDSHYALCFWGCRLWSLVGMQKADHEHDECKRRVMVCRLGCPVMHEAFQWQQCHGRDQSELEWHEVYECSSRLIKCPRDCGVWVSNDALQHHTDFTCVKRPVPDLACRVGCGKVFAGANNRILELEQERKWHEMEACPNRIVSCAWPGCDVHMMAKDRKLHRAAHLCASGITTFKTSGSFEFVVPKDCKHIKIQAWGGGGGSGVLHGYKFGHGGGGAFVEAISPVHPGETLLIVVGEGGRGGVFGHIHPSHTPDGLPLVSQVGQAVGGLPGGGSGHSSNNGWACGGGGGYTSICRKGPFGIITLVLVGGGGGGGCRDGLGAGDDKPLDPAVKVDMRNGGMGSPLQGGAPGQVSTPTPAFGATGGQQYQGGSGAEFGGGGGGGYFGGGGGGYSPGIVGGGGGGSSFVDRTLLENAVMEKASKRVPGGLDRHPPAATNDEGGGVCGEGGFGSIRGICPGNDGCVRVALPVQENVKSEMKHT